MPFFIVGAPRCGTTALSRYLKAHTGVCFAKPKEPQYFATADLAGLPDTALRETVAADYVGRFFRRNPEDTRILGEGSVSYLYSPDAIETILRWDPDARFIVMLRNPLDMLRSYHARLLYILDEDEEDFERAWRLQDARATGRRIPATCRDAKLLNYAEVARLGTYTAQLMDIAGQERVLPVVHDDLKDDPRMVYRGALDFIGLPDDGRETFPRIRASSGIRSRALQRVLQRPPTALARLATDRASQVAPAPGAGGGTDGRATADKGLTLNPRKLRKRLLAWNTTDRPSAPLSPALDRELRDFYRDDVARLGDLIGRDLSSWLSKPDTARASRPVSPPGETAGARPCYHSRLGTAS